MVASLLRWPWPKRPCEMLWVERWLPALSRRVSLGVAAASLGVVPVVDAAAAAAGVWEGTAGEVCVELAFHALMIPLRTSVSVCA